MAIVNDEQVMKVLRQYNPWWRVPSAIREESKPQKRVAYYEALKMLTHKSIRRFVVLSGMRRVGKTTILYQIIEHLIDEGVNPKNILYVTFDNPILKLIHAEHVLATVSYTHLDVYKRQPWSGLTKILWCRLPRQGWKFLCIWSGLS